VNETEWLTFPDPLAMLLLMGESLNDARKRRLFAAACCRRISHLLTDNGRQAVHAAEQFADGLIRRQELHRFWTAVGFPRAQARMFAASAARAASCSPGTELTAHAAASAVNAVASEEGAKARRLRTTEKAAQAVLLRDIFGNPFQPVSLDRSWQTSTVLSLATAAYEGRVLPGGTLDLDRLAILADALEDAGCTHAGLLGHLRSPGPHVRGCWIVDLLLAASL